MYDDVAILKTPGEVTYDANLNEVITVTEKQVFVQPRGVYASEFYGASQLGLKPSLTLMLTNRADYNGQTVLTFHGKDYNVIRADWDAQRDGLNLICEERVNNENGIG